MHVEVTHFHPPLQVVTPKRRGGALDVCYIGYVAVRDTYTYPPRAAIRVGVGFDVG